MCRLNHALGLRVCLALLRGTFPWNICSSANGHQLAFHASLVEHAYLLGFTANSNCSHLFTTFFSCQDSRIVCNILPEAEVSHLYHAPTHGERCETSCFAIAPRGVCYS